MLQAEQETEGGEQQRRRRLVWKERSCAAGRSVDVLPFIVCVYERVCRFM